MIVHKILIADDQAEIRRLLRRVFGIDGQPYDIIEATDGAQALRLARESRPDLVLLDVEMPVRDGISVCQAIRQDAALAGMKVVLLSGTASAASQELSGADAFVRKPFRMNELCALVDQLLEP